MRRVREISGAERFGAHYMFPMAGRSRHPFRMPESTLGIGTLPQQTGVYVPRRLNQANGPVASISSHSDCDTLSLPLSHG